MHNFRRLGDELHPSDSIRCDRGVEFIGGFQSFCEESSIEIRRSSSRHPQSQGVVEIINRSLFEILRRLVVLIDLSEEVFTETVTGVKPSITSAYCKINSAHFFFW